MDIPYSFLDKQVNKQFKDLAFFQILKRKGPYIERSLTKIENDLFHKHKLSGHKMKNVAFIKEIRMTLAAYEILINQIKNDFMMTELDSLGDSIHKLFTQMISIINFFSAIILKREKLAFNELMDVNLEELKEKQQVIKKMEEEQKVKLTQEKQRQNQRLKEIQQLKYNFRELFKMQINGDKESRLIENLWKAIALENKNNVNECMKIKDSEVSRIIRDSCQYMYKNHTELENIVRLTKQDISLSQKNLNSFTDKGNLIEENEKKINQMKTVGTEIVEYVRERVYDKKNVQIQTMLTMMENPWPFITTKQLDEKRKMELSIRNYQKTFREKQNYIEQIQKRLRDNEERHGSYQDKRNSGQNQSDSDEDIQNNIVANKFFNLSRKSKFQNYNSFKISPTSKTSAITAKTREASFTMGKNFIKQQKQSSDPASLQQKSNKRSSSTFKDFTMGYRHSNNKSAKRMASNFDLGLVPSQNSSGKKFYKVRQSHLVMEAKQYEEISRKSENSRVNTAFEDDDKENADKEKCDDDLSIDDLQSYKESGSVTNDINKEPEQDLSPKQKSKKMKNSSGFTISSTFKIVIRPARAKRYLLQSACKHHSQQKQALDLFQSRALKSSKLKKSTSQGNISRYYFEPLDNLERFGSNTHYQDVSMLGVSGEKRKPRSAARKYQDLKNLSSPNIQKENIQKSDKNQRSTVPQLNAISFIKLKNYKMNKPSLKQNSSILKGYKKQSQNILKKSSTTKQTVSFAFLPGSSKKRRLSMHLKVKQQKSQIYQNKFNRVTIGGQNDLSYVQKSDEIQNLGKKTIIQQENQNFE